MRPTLTTVRHAVRTATPALALGTAALTAALAACAESPTAPGASAPITATRAALDAPSFSKHASAADSVKATKDAAEKAAKAAKDAAKDAAKAAKDAAKDAAKAAKDAQHRLSDDQLSELAATFHTTPADQEAGADTASAMTCRDAGRETASAQIGPKGGELKIGPNRLVVPAGALTAPVTITGTAVRGLHGPLLTFAPHGLQFQKGVEIVADYHGCSAPAGAPVNVFYVAPGHAVLQVMPSADHGAKQQIRALTDHFSGYLVSSGRR